MVVVALDYRQKVAAKHLEDHTHVAAMRAYVVEAIHKLDGAAVGVQLTPARRSTHEEREKGIEDKPVTFVDGVVMRLLSMS